MRPPPGSTSGATTWLWIYCEPCGENHYAPTTPKFQATVEPETVTKGPRSFVLIACFKAARARAWEEYYLDREAAGLHYQPEATSRVWSFWVACTSCRGRHYAGSEEDQFAKEPTVVKAGAIILGTIDPCDRPRGKVQSLQRGTSTLQGCYFCGRPLEHAPGCPETPKGPFESACTACGGLLPKHNVPGCPGGKA